MYEDYEGEIEERVQARLREKQLDGIVENHIKAGESQQPLGQAQ